MPPVYTGAGIRLTHRTIPIRVGPAELYRKESAMDLGIAGRKAIVCASSRGLGRACAEALAQAGCNVVINGLDPTRLETTAAEIRKSTGARITPVAGDIATAEG